MNKSWAFLTPNVIISSKTMMVRYQLDNCFHVANMATWRDCNEQRGDYYGGTPRTVSDHGGVRTGL